MVSNKNIANAVGGKTARACDNCIRKRARWYCAADDAFLCQSCDSSVHSANSLARRHERVRLKSASSENININSNSNNCNSSPSWHKGFTKKARTPRPGNSSAVRLRKKSDEVLSLLPNPFFSLVPEGDETTEHEHEEEEEEDEKLLYRVPIFDPFVGDNENESRVLDKENLHGGFLPSDMDLAEFAADVESLLGRNLENECFDMEGLGLMNCEEKGIGCSLSDGKVKLEEEKEEICGKKFVTEIDLMKEPFELNFEDYDDVPSSCNEEDEKTAIGGAVTMTMAGVKHERENYDDELKMKKKKKVGLSLDCDSVIAAWGGDRSPWTNGERPDFYPDDDCWPDCMATCGVNYRHSCGDFGVIGGHPTAMTDGGREARVSRYREKRRTRLFSKKIRYEVRKLNAEKRPRMKGRFVKRTPFAPPNLPILSI